MPFHAPSPESLRNSPKNRHETRCEPGEIEDDALGFEPANLDDQTNPFPQQDEFLLDQIKCVQIRLNGCSGFA